jgi:DNA polymerase III sliding clamp (beta) subunit (PCNA family)
MATLQEPISNGAKLLHGYAIPAISHFLKKSINNAWLYNKTHLQIQNENVAIITKLSDCSFPPYEKIIPQTQSVKAFVNSSILLKKTKIIASMEPKKPYGMDLSLNGKLTLSYNDSHTGETKIDIESVKYPSNFMDIEARYNPRYIADALTGGKDEEATLAWEWENDKDGPLNPIKIDQGNKTAIIMPIRK